MILGIDPSFTRTGIVLLDGENILLSKNISSNEPVYQEINKLHFGAIKIVDEIVSVLDNLFTKVDVIVEYPALATRSGGYLAILNGILASTLYKHNSVLSVTWVPPTACDSFTKNAKHSKSYLVEFCKTNGWISSKERVSHDICTALIFCYLLKAINEGSYKNKYFKVYLTDDRDCYDKSSEVEWIP